MENFRIEPEFQNKIPPIGEDEFRQLRENILAAGEVYEPLVVWDGVLVDGHNRWKVIQGHPEIKWRTREMDFADKWAAFEWMYKNQLGRRNLTDEQRTYTIGKMLEARKHTLGGDRRSEEFSAGQNDRLKRSRKEIKEGTAGDIGREVGMSEKNVRRAEHFAQGVDALREVSPEAADEVLSGRAKVPKSVVSEIGRLEREDVEAAADAILTDMAKPKPPAPNPGRYNREYREIKEMIQKAIAPLRDIDSAPEYTIDSLIENIETNGANYVNNMRETLEARRELFKDADAKVRVFRAIASIIQDLAKVRGEYTK